MNRILEKQDGEWKIACLGFHYFPDTLLHWSQEQQVRTIVLGSIERFEAARKFYIRNGFEEMAKQDLPPKFPRMPLDTLFFRKNMGARNDV